MRTFPLRWLILALALGFLPVNAFPQTTRKSPAAVSPLQHALDLAAGGHCDQALPLLGVALPHLAAKRDRYAVVMAQARCAMSLGRDGVALQAITLLHREFPNDPQALFISAQYLSVLGDRAAHHLAVTAPDSAQAMQLEAEMLESHGKFQEALDEYRRIIAKYPNAVGIHYRIGRILFLDEPSTADSAAQAKKEFEEEIRIDPHSAAAEFMLGDIAWKAQDWPAAIGHFSRATHDDAGFSEAFLGLGVSLNGAGKYAQAVAPLEKYVKMEPGDPAGHYQLALAYARTGKQKEAQLQLALQREAAQKRAQSH
jgi:predicted Zn-dependent protease